MNSPVKVWLGSASLPAKILAANFFVSFVLNEFLRRDDLWRLDAIKLWIINENWVILIVLYKYYYLSPLKPVYKVHIDINFNTFLFLHNFNFCKLNNITILKHILASRRPIHFVCESFETKFNWTGYEQKTHCRKGEIWAQSVCVVQNVFTTASTAILTDPTLDSRLYTNHSVLKIL